MYSRIVVPLDGSYLAERALIHAEELARRTGAPLHLVRIVDITRLERFGTHGFEMTGAALAQAIDEENATAHDYLGRSERRVSAGGVATTSEMRLGLAARELALICQPGDLIVMTAHGRSGLSGSHHLGSVVEELLRRSQAPILVLRPDHPAPHH